MTIKELQARLTELDRQITRLKNSLESYKTGKLDFDELTSVVNASLTKIKETAKLDRRHQAA